MPSVTHVSRLIGEKLAEFLSDQTWDGNIGTVQAVYRRTPDYTAEELAELKVSVVPGPIEVANQTISRGESVAFEVRVGVLVGRRVENDQDIADLEDLTMQAILAVRTFNEQISELGDGYAWTEINQPAPFDRQSLMDSGVFLSQVEIVYLVPFPA